MFFTRLIWAMIKFGWDDSGYSKAEREERRKAEIAESRYAQRS